MPSRTWAVIFTLFGLGNLINGLWMLANPAHWYVHLPANVPGTGPLNEHFVRDIGCIFTLMGIALLWAARVPKLRFGAMLFAAAFSSAHALVHVFDTARGLLPPSQWLTDLVPIYGAAALMVALAVVLRPQGRRE